MMTHFHSAPMLGMAVAWLATAGLVFAGQPPIRDDGHFFSPETMTQGDQVIKEIKQRYNQNLVIETFPKVSPLARVFHNLKDPAGRARFFVDWAQRNARKAGANSVYVLICREPAPVHVEIVVGRDTQVQAFLAADRDQLQDRLASQVQSGHFDAGLLEAVHFVQTTLRAHLGAAVVPAEPFPWESILGTIGVMLGVWLCVETVQALHLSRSRESGLHLGVPGYGGCGSLPAGLFATMTSNWVRDLMHRTSPAAAESATAPEAMPALEEPAEQGDTAEDGDRFRGPDVDDLDYYHQNAGHQDNG